MRVLLLRAESFEKTVDGKRLTVIVKYLAVGALQQLKRRTQSAANMVCGLVCSCVPSRMPVQSVYPAVQLLCPILELPLRPAQLKRLFIAEYSCFCRGTSRPELTGNLRVFLLAISDYVFSRLRMQRNYPY